MPVEALTAAAATTTSSCWTNPVKAVSGRPVGPLGAVEIWVFDRGLPAGGGPLTPGESRRSARLVRRIPRPEFGALPERGRAPAS